MIAVQVLSGYVTQHTQRTKLRLPLSRAFCSFLQHQQMEQSEESEILDGQTLADVLAFVDDRVYAYSNNLVSHEEAGGERWTGLRLAILTLHNKLAEVDSSAALPRGAKQDEQRRVSAGRIEPMAVTEIHRLLDECQRRMRQQLQRCVKTPVATIPNGSVVVLLRRQLDALLAHVASASSERPLLERRRVVEDVSDVYFRAPRRGVAVRFRSGRVFPFKMSVLTEAAWRVVLDGLIGGPVQCKGSAAWYANELLVGLRDDRDGTDGAMVVRQVHLPDGHVVLCWTGISAAPRAVTYAPSNLVGDAEVHRFGWIRLGRHTPPGRATSSRPCAFLEGVSDVVVRPSSREVRSDDSDTTTARRLARFKTFLFEQSDRDSKKNRQSLENWMLDAALAEPRTPEATPLDQHHCNCD